MLALAGGVAYGGVRVAQNLRASPKAPVAVADSSARQIRQVSSSPTPPATAPTPRSRESSGDVARRATPPATKTVATFDVRAERDSMRAAFAEGMAVERDGESGPRWFRRASVHATRVIERGTAGSREYTPERLVRARSCLLGRLECPRATVSEDLTWVLVFGDNTQRRMAVRLLERIGA